jgi:hypothetical protein
MLDFRGYLRVAFFLWLADKGEIRPREEIRGKIEIILKLFIDMHRIMK